ncbi:hypothetical protein Afil01_22780 [Actinorhabdospora filicis]|uniref:Uncharacterized protein n=1 Tax=Actinorhabdospora filicis TaxID=1785913 RepID=A0A9W6SMT7_9ACTN|nr:hypothetical protein Afil01_22780 [Actinorhabdospora filicis]
MVAGGEAFSVGRAAQAAVDHVRRCLPKRRWQVSQIRGKLSPPIQGIAARFPAPVGARPGGVLQGLLAPPGLSAGNPVTGGLVPQGTSTGFDY